ncbi:IS66 family transposase [Ruminococcus albus]|uniref:IS66 family transposase n=1 Tax=Ruminococcus albus TaxID=1264 RepID=UPI001FA83384|nr:IS66 family transposase [Ruminococcus albus]
MTESSYIIFDYQPTRKGEHFSTFLKDFTGYLICDGYFYSIRKLKILHTSN